MKKIVQFINSIYFIILVNLLAIIFWYLKEPATAYIIYLVFCIIIILTKANRSVIASLILSAIITYRVEDESSLAMHEVYAKIFIPLGIIAIVLFVIDIIRRKTRFKFSLIFFGFLSVLVVNILSFINVEGKDLTYIATLGILQLLAFVIIYVYLLNTHDNEGKKYISSVALITATAITIELAISYIMLDGLPNKGDNDLFWAVSNTIAMFYLVLIPIGLYNYFRDQKNYYVLLITGFNFFMMLFMLSRGAYLALGILIIPTVITMALIAKDKKRLLIDTFATTLICIIVSYAVGTKLGLLEMLKEYFEEITFFEDNGRKELYIMGFDLFKEYPIFGAGSYSGAYYLKDYSLGTYHNYIVQAIATTGILGIISLGFFIYSVIKTSLKKNYFNILYLISFLYILIHGLVDNSFYNPIIMIFLACTMPFLEEYHENLEDLKIN